MTGSSGEQASAGATAVFIAILRDPESSGREAAAAALWAKFYDRLVRAARAAYPNVKRSADPEDMALSAFKSVVSFIESGSPKAPIDGFGLWLLLLTRMRWKSCNHLRKERTLRRGGKVVNWSALDDDALLELPSPELPPDMLEMFAEGLRASFEALPDDELRLVARLRLDGYKIEEIGREIGLGRASVNRKLDRIRRIWWPDEDRNDEPR